MNLRKKMFDQLIGKIKTCHYVSNYFTFLWNFVNAEIDDPNFVNDKNYEISGYYTKTGNPLLINTEKD